MLKVVLDTTPVRFFWKDRESVYLGCNQAFAHDMGLEAPDDRVPRVRDPVEASGEGDAGEVDVEHPGGRVGADATGDRRLVVDVTPECAGATRREQDPTEGRPRKRRLGEGRATLCEALPSGRHRHGEGL